MLAIIQSTSGRFAQPVPQREPMRPAQRAYTVTVKTADGTEQINVIGFTTCDAILRAIDILFDGDEPMPLGGLSIAAHPMVKVAA